MRNRSKKPKKKIEFSNYGTKENQVRTSSSRYASEEMKIPNECRYKSNYYINSTVCFMGRFKFGVKDQIINLAKAFGFPTSASLAKSTGILVVDDLNRTNSVMIDRARKEGVLILNEEEFLYLISSNKRNTEIIYEKE